ncbi:MAG: septum formation initiator family protein [Hyphomonadaceae bacterium]|nr:septum formation initiator family protein [Hyphomonadaceae bacterium]MBX3510178.1 septum formation initiator family protein [Hyphomonadaceae bacterium]
MSKGGATVLGIVLGGAIIYLGAHAVTGRQGLIAYVDLQAQERSLEQRLDRLEGQRAALEARAARMRPESLDLDYLDERARVTLAAGNREELVFAVE